MFYRMEAMTFYTLTHLSLYCRSNLVCLALMEVDAADNNLETEIQRMCALYDIHTTVNKKFQNSCHACKAPCALLKCIGCDRRFHPLCLSSPSLTCKHLPNKRWNCPDCAHEHEYGVELTKTDEESASHTERMGLTPDWMITAAAFDVFGLSRPTASCPRIMGLLDPCTNSKIAPNIPAEVLYDKVDNGLKLSNSWADFFIILNPDCTF